MYIWLQMPLRACCSVQKRPPKSGLRFSNSQAIHSENARTVLLAVVRHTHEANYKETSLQKLIYEQDLQLGIPKQIFGTRAHLTEIEENAALASVYFNSINENKQMVIREQMGDAIET